MNALLYKTGQLAYFNLAGKIPCKFPLEVIFLNTAASALANSYSVCISKFPPSIGFGILLILKRSAWDEIKFN